MTGRGSTHRGQLAALPDRDYADRAGPAAVAVSRAGHQLVAFHGEDGRQAVFDFAGLPLPGWHRALAAGLAERTGPAGGLRTLASAAGNWAVMKRLMRFLASQPDAPRVPADLTLAHMEEFLRRRTTAIGDAAGWGEVRSAGRLLASVPDEHRAPQEVLDFVFQRVEGLAFPATTGYSDNELRQVITAARTDAACLRDRLRSGHALAARAQQDTSGLTGEQQHDAQLIAGIAATGKVPQPGHDRVRSWTDRLEVAGRLFVTRTDMWPLMVLLVALTGRSPDALKELPAEHRLLGNAAVELVLVKRRRGPGRWQETVTWEIGPPGRKLHHPGGFYLLLHELMAPGRQFSGSPLVWSVWRNAPGDAPEHVSPFARSLTMPLLRPSWDEARGLTGDDGQPLRIDLRRVKTSIEVRRTRQLGGHLPSAARTNTMPVLFRNYLRGDPTVRDWAEQVVGEAVADAEKQALAAHARAMRQTGGGPVVAGIRGRPFRAGDHGHDEQELEAGAVEGPWSACSDPQAHPVTGRPCQVSLLDCLHCGNCVISAAHLSRLVALAEALASRRQKLAEDDWWQRYGPAWAAIRHDILPRFTPAQVSQAIAAAPRDAALDLAESPWEMP